MTINPHPHPRRRIPSQSVAGGATSCPVMPSARCLSGLRRCMGQTLGIWGWDRSARGVALRAQGFNMRVVAYDPTWEGSDSLPPAILSDTPGERGDVRWVRSLLRLYHHRYATIYVPPHSFWVSSRSYFRMPLAMQTRSLTMRTSIATILIVLSRLSIRRGGPRLRRVHIQPGRVPQLRHSGVGTRPSSRGTGVRGRLAAHHGRDAGADACGCHPGEGSGTIGDCVTLAAAPSHRAVPVLSRVLCTV